jgi:type IV pilus assembly protein PilA
MKLKSLRKNKKGFTLVELIVVLAIIAIMLAVTVPSFITYVNQANTEMGALNDRNVKLEAQLATITAITPAP